MDVLESSNATTSYTPRCRCTNQELLLQEYELGVSMPIDESIAAYLYCLWKADQRLPLRQAKASSNLVDNGGRYN